MPKTPRNAPCPCGSGKKFKKCHGAYERNLSFNAGLAEKLRELEAQRVRREQQQGLGRPIIATKFHGQQLVAVGNRMHFSPQWKTFHDFLRDFFLSLLGKHWITAERTKPANERHIIARWYEQSLEGIKQYQVADGEIFSAPMTGATRAFLNLAYNIYLIAHHAPGNHDKRVNEFISRLKSPRTDDVIGALFETYAAAAFLKSGFHVEYENEKDGSTSHVEFVATYPKTGKQFSVEVKTRDRSSSPGSDGNIDDVKRLRVGNKLNKALGKKADHTRVVLIEVNVPDVAKEATGWPTAALKQIRDTEKVDFPSGEKKPSAYVLVTNHSYHNNLGAIDTGLAVVATGFRIPDFGPNAVHHSYKSVLESRERHFEIFALLKSMETHYEIPSTFDGEIPELAFQADEKLPRLQFGHWYLVPNENGEEVPGCLYDATVNELKKEVVGVYRLATGNNIVATCPISDVELEAYRRYPDTFFGQVRQRVQRAETVVDLCDFFYETYKDTPREKLLEWLAGASDFKSLELLSQHDLAITLCERWAWTAFNHSNRKKAS